MLKVMKFSASWCHPCKILAPVWEKIAIDIQDVEFVAVDVDREPELTANFKIFSIPTIVFLKDNLEVSRMIGLVKEKDIRDLINGHKE